MKKVTARKFYHNAGLMDALPEGRELIVTANGKPKFMVRKSSPPRMTRQLAEARSVGDPRLPKFDGTAFLASLKK